MFNTNNLNGALYPLHSHINHSCQPNAKAIDLKGRLSEINGFIFLSELIEVVARQDGIAQGDEVTVSYVNPEWPGQLRRDILKRDYGFDCHCQKCCADLVPQVKDGKEEYECKRI
jgi:SET domain